MLSLREWIDSSGARYASHVEQIVRGLGYDTVDRFPPVQVIDRNYEEFRSVLDSLSNASTSVLVVPPQAARGAIRPIIPGDLSRTPGLYVTPQLQHEPPAVALQSIAFCLALMDGCTRCSAWIARAPGRSLDLATDAAGIGLQYLASRFAFDCFLRALAQEKRRFDVANFLKGSFDSWNVAMSETEQDADLARTACLSVLTQFAGRAEALKKCDIDPWTQESEGQLTPADLFGSSFGPEWRGLTDLFAELDTVESVLARRAEIAERLDQLAAPNDHLSMATFHANQASALFWDAKLPWEGKPLALSQRFDRALDEIEAARQAGEANVLAQLEAFGPLIAQIQTFMRAVPEGQAAISRYLELLKTSS